MTASRGTAIIGHKLKVFTMNAMCCVALRCVIWCERTNEQFATTTADTDGKDLDGVTYLFTHSKYFIGSFTLLFEHVDNLPFSQIFPTIDSLPASGLTPRLYDWSVSSEHLGF